MKVNNCGRDIVIALSHNKKEGVSKARVIVNPERSGCGNLLIDNGL